MSLRLLLTTFTVLDATMVSADADRRDASASDRMSVASTTTLKKSEAYKLADIEVAREDDFSVCFNVRSHLGLHLEAGDNVLGSLVHLYSAKCQ